jgi:ferredoxin like protein
MTTPSLGIEAKLGLDVFALDKQAHITVNQEVCRGQCRTRLCLAVCPAHLYSLGPAGEILLNYEGCLECGACKLACPHGALDWRYPRGGYGVQYRLG